MSGEESWATDEVTWGIYSVPETEWHLLPDDLAGKDTIELGCGTAYVSAWLAKRGAKPVGIDNSPKQLETARRLQQEHGIEFPLLLGNAEEVPYPGRVVRLCHQRIRRRDLVRSLQMDSGSGAVAASRRRADVPGKQRAD